MERKPKGYVITADISNINKIECDEVWQITRSGNTISGTIWEPALAPSHQLYKRYLNEWKDGPAEEWWSLYKEIFEKELGTPEKLNALIKLTQLIKAGKVIALVCYCRDSKYCHRTLVSEALQKHGINVEEYVAKKSIYEIDAEQQTLF